MDQANPQTPGATGGSSTPLPEAASTGDAQIQKQNSKELLKELSAPDSPQVGTEQQPNAAAGDEGRPTLVTMMSKEQLMQLSQLLRAGKAGSALELVRPLLTRRRKGPDGKMYDESVDRKEAAKFLLEAMEVMEGQNGAGAVPGANPAVEP